jgi:hypothetical protein
LHFLAFVGKSRIGDGITAIADNCKCQTIASHLERNIARDNNVQKTQLKVLERAIRSDLLKYLSDRGNLVRWSESRPTPAPVSERIPRSIPKSALIVPQASQKLRLGIKINMRLVSHKSSIN